MAIMARELCTQPAIVVRQCRGRVVSPMGEPEYEVPAAIVERGDRSAFALVRDLCWELRRAIDAASIAYTAGLELRIASEYLSRLERRGVLVVTHLRPSVCGTGRRMKVYRISPNAKEEA